MGRVKGNLIQKVIKIHPSQQEMLDACTNNWGIISESDVFRQALTFFYRKMEPQYLKPSIQQMEKIDKRTEEEKMAAMSNEDWVEQIGRMKVVENADGEKYVVYFAIPYPRAVKLEKAKEFFMEVSPGSLTYHLQRFSREDMGKDMVVYAGVLWEKYRIGEPPPPVDVVASPPVGRGEDELEKFLTAPENHVANDPPTDQDIRELQEEPVEEGNVTGPYDERADEEDSESLV